MSHPHFELKDVRRDDIRAACAALDETLARLPETTPVEREIRTRWAELLELLALEPARVLRACPVCHHVGMFEATRCGHCWAKLPVAAADDAITSESPASHP